MQREMRKQQEDELLNAKKYQTDDNSLKKPDDSKLSKEEKRLKELEY